MRTRFGTVKMKAPSLVEALIHPEEIMFRVIYRWQVEPEDFEEFKNIWRATTNTIHESVPGALGSFMLRACEKDSEILTIAKWESKESWKVFWGANNPKEMEAMRKLGNRISIEIYDEIEDRTR